MRPLKIDDSYVDPKRAEVYPTIVPGRYDVKIPVIKITAKDGPVEYKGTGESYNLGEFGWSRETATAIARLLSERRQLREAHCLKVVYVEIDGEPDGFEIDELQLDVLQAKARTIARLENTTPCERHQT